MAPESLYLNGECVTRGQLGSECRFHEQCGAAEGMTCVKGQCQCIDGFSPLSDVITHPTKNPSQQCRRECDKSSSISRDTNCLSKSQLGGPCFVQEQCPDQAGCYRGRCLCRCGYKMANSKCIPLPPPSTQRPQTVPSWQKILLNFLFWNFSCSKQSGSSWNFQQFFYWRGSGLKIQQYIHIINFIIIFNM
ncbi:unnamed protein product [Meloidogyne enterolobii]|uniref:Uncharacterized protein n=1 Tax=Meloidogyne enterolobii TaxID=390850 RepID=A0ACB0YJ36_MELEN